MIQDMPNLVRTSKLEDSESLLLTLTDGETPPAVLGQSEEATYFSQKNH